MTQLSIQNPEIFVKMNEQGNVKLSVNEAGHIQIDSVSYDAITGAEKSSTVAIERATVQNDIINNDNQITLVLNELARLKERRRCLMIMTAEIDKAIDAEILGMEKAAEND